MYNAAAAHSCNESLNFIDGLYRPDKKKLMLHYISIGLSLSKKKKKVRKIPFQSKILNRLRKREEEEEEVMMMYGACPLVIMHGYLVMCHHA